MSNVAFALQRVFLLPVILLFFMMSIHCGIKQFDLLQDEAIAAAGWFGLEPNVIPTLAEIS